MTDKKPLILITNDDSIYAKGLKELVDAVKDLGLIYVISTLEPRSGNAHCVTTNTPIFINKISEYQNQIWYSCSGTPADCVKIGLGEILPRYPDICLSGINHGENHSISVHYSGTMGAAIEAGFHNIPAIGFSLANYDPDANFSFCKSYIRNIALQALRDKSKESAVSVLNVNIPYTSIKGIKVCRQAKAYWKENFIKRKDPLGKNYYWLDGNIIFEEELTEETDAWAIKNGYISIVPIQKDMTCYSTLKKMNYEK